MSYIRTGRLHPVSEIIPQIIVDLKSRRFVHGRSEGNGYIILDGHLLGVTSIRLRCFATKGLKCAQCGVEGQYFALEKSHKSEPSYHINLYAVGEGGYEILMTKDHILARADGGKDHLDNLQTMCSPCNIEKASDKYREIQEKLLRNRPKSRSSAV